MFVDATSGHNKVEFQTLFSTQETIKAIKRCEQKARDNRITVQGCQFKNGSSFMSRSLREHPLEEGQTSPISRARSHHQNGKAKRGMKTTMGSARTMSPHSASHWSDTEDAGPWSVSVQQAVWINNHLLSRNAGLSPHDLWSKTKHPLRKSHNAHAFGCPVCVLQKRLLDGMSTP